MKLGISKIFILFIITLNLTFAKEELVFSALQNSSLGKMVEEVLIEAYAKIDIEAKMRGLPGARALNIANSGEVDGAQLRVETILKKYKNLIMIPTPVYETEIVVFVKNKKFKVDGWDSLKPYRIGAPAGYTAILSHLKGFNYWELTYEQIFKMLDSGRVDIGVVDRFNGLNTIAKLNLKDINYLPTPLKTIKFYNFLHKKHKNILPKITKAMRELKEEGRLKEIWQKYEKKLFESSD